MSLVKSLEWRYATKKFDSTKKISLEDLETLKHAVQLSASSYGVQAYKVLLIEDPKVRKQLTPVSWGQSQIEDCSVIFAFCSYKQVTAQLIDEYVHLISKTRNMPEADLAGYGDLMKSKITTMSPETNANWAARQAYIALGTLLTACASLKIDACPMEGFDASEYDQILNLAPQGLTTSVIATVGYRSTEDGYAHLKKVRKSYDDLFVTI